jgi:hypothetical protein
LQSHCIRDFPFFQKLPTDHETVPGRDNLEEKKADKTVNGEVDYKKVPARGQCYGF